MRFALFFRIISINRVLDVTQNPLVALYFALEKVETNNGNELVIYLIYAEKSNAGYLINNELQKFYSEELEKKILKREILMIIVVVSNVLGEKIVSRKFLDKKKMFAEIVIKK